MFIVILLIDFVKFCLDCVMVENLCNVWGGGEVQWLVIGEVVEFLFFEKLDNFWLVWEDL